MDQFVDQYMNPLIQSFRKIIQFLEKEKVSYTIIGGIANSFYGNPRQTFDIDIKFEMDEQNVSGFIQQLSTVGRLAADDPIAFFKETAVIPVDIDNVRVDLVRSLLPFEKEAIRRSKREAIFGLKALVCTAEDLIIQKAVSVRDKDWMDISAIIHLQYTKLDWDYLMQHIKDLSVFLDDPQIENRIKKIKNEA